MDDAPTASCTASTRGLSHIGGNQGRPGRKRSDGGAGNPIWVDRPAQCLVSDQPSGRRLFPTSAKYTAQLAAFQPSYLILAVVIHLVTSLLVGLLYGATLPMFPRRPILLAGVIAPILWSGLIHSFLEFVNPVLNKRIDWLWFVISQVGFGIAAGIVVSKQQRVPTWQHLPFAVRAGMEAPGAMDERNGEDRQS